MLVLGFGTYDKAKHPRVAVLLAGLRNGGERVVELNRPLLLPTDRRVEVLRRPWLAYRPLLQVVLSWASLAVASRRYRGASRPGAVVVGYLGHFDVLLARLLFPRSVIVLDQMVFAADTARDRGVRSPVALALLKTVDSLACRAADLVVVDTPEHARLLPPSQRAKTVVAPVGAPEEWLAAGEGRRYPCPTGTQSGGTHSAGTQSGGAQPGRPLRVVFFGLYTPLQGTTVVGRTLALLAGREDVEVTMVGRGQELEETRRLAGTNDRVTWIDWVPAGELPGLVAAHDVCLGIFGTSEKASRVVPNKVYQGAAAGCAVVTSNTEPQRRALGRSAVLVPPGDPQALAEALATLAGDRARAAALGRSAAAVARSEFRPENVVGELQEALRHRAGRGQVQA